MPNATQSVRLRAFAPERDLPLVAEWLRRPHVTRWWGNPSDSLTAVREHRVKDSALICLGSVPVGYLCWQIPTRPELEVAGLADLPRDLVDVDIFIGESTATGHGVGSEALNQLCDELRRRGVRLVGLAAAAQNRAACRAYEKAGFRHYRHFREGGGNMNYFTKALRAAA